ncbi:MAG: HD domain-containing phosphohydrolase [Planctomycetota bacterium]
MSLYPRWMLVILVALVQLLAFLAVHLWIADNTLREHASLLVQSTQSENRIVMETAMYRVLRLSRADRSSSGRLKIEIAGIARTDQSGIAIINARDGSQICESVPKSDLLLDDSEVARPEWDWSETIVETELENRDNAVSLVERLKIEGGEPFSCSVIDGNQARLITARSIPQSNLALIVYKDRSTTFHSAFDDTFYSLRRIGFGAILLIGVVGCGLMMSMLTRIGKRINKISGQLEGQVEARTREIRRTQSAIIFGLAKLAESRDNDTGDHLERISRYVSILASDLRGKYDEIDERYVSDLELASSLHDIGKVGIPDSILLKPGRLTTAERDVMEFHTVIGGECLEAIEQRLGENGFMQLAREVAYHHHERWDGTGYPHGLSEEAIPLAARIVAVADVYDALTSKRPYKRAMSHMESRGIIVSGSGQHFDPEVVDAFLRHEDEFLEISVEQQGVSDEEATSNIQRLTAQVTSTPFGDVTSTPMVGQ